MKRIGLYGGTFSPPHIGHVHAARIFWEQGELDAMIVMPTFLPPHKTRTEQTSSEDRLAMCRLAFSFSSAVTVSDLEIQRKGKSYTSETLRLLTKPNQRLVFLCGTDMFLTMDDWHEPQTIFSLAEIACIRRECDENDGIALMQKAEVYRKKYGAEIRFLHADAIEASSSDIRAKIQNGEEWKHLLSTEVASYVEEKGLYR